MKVAEVHELVSRVAAIDSDCADRQALETAAVDLCRLRSWLDGREVSFARSLSAVTTFPEKSLADAARSSLRQAERIIHRAETVDQVPEFRSSLEAGRVTGGHVDVLSRAIRKLDPAVKQRLVAVAPSLVLIAEHATVDEFARTVGAEARRLERDSDGLDRLERQRRAVRFESWIDRETGMGRWSATWDPETMVRLENRIEASVQAMFHDMQPEGCPVDLLEKQSFLRAHAVLSLFEGTGPRLGRPEIVVVVDHTQPDPDGRPSIDWGLPVDLPRRVLDDLHHTANVLTVVVRDGAVVDAPGRLNLGRSTRVANRAQRRALRAQYATCAIPGCHVRYSRTKLHHVIWWEHGGATDLDNLLPLCERHHQKVHHDGWFLSLASGRTLTIRFPDGEVMTTGPPKRNAA
jgi:hypothetical protein